MRAARALWSAAGPRVRPAEPQVAVACGRTRRPRGWSLTAQDVFNNVGRTCIEAMAATQGHTQSLHTNALDEAIALPTDFSARIARNTQLLLQQESGTTGTIDPWAGSYYVERLTHDLAERAWAHIQEAEQAGGMAKAIEQGIPKMRIEEAAARTQARIDSGAQKVIGVNTYRLAAEDKLDVLKVDNDDVYRQQIAKLERLRAERDDDEVRRTLEALTRSAERRRRARARSTATCSPSPSTRPAPRPPSARSPTRSRRSTAGTRPPSVRSAACSGTSPARRRHPRPAGARRDRRVRGGRGPPAAHPGRQDGPGRPRPRPEGHRLGVRRHGLRRRRGPAVLHAGGGRPAGGRRRRAHRRRLLAGRRPPHAAAGAEEGARGAGPPRHHGRDRRGDPARRRADAQGDGRGRGVPARHRHRRVRARPAGQAARAARPRAQCPTSTPSSRASARSAARRSPRRSRWSSRPSASTARPPASC